MSNRWHRKFIGEARHVASWSKDDSTKVGAIIVDPTLWASVGTGYNGFPRRVNDDIPARHLRPAKYLYTEHAERNAIYNAMRVDLRGCILYLSWSPVNGICGPCARGIIQKGITMVIGPTDRFPGKGEQWLEECAVAMEMLLEAGVHLLEVDMEAW